MSNTHPNRSSASQTTEFVAVSRRLLKLDELVTAANRGVYSDAEPSEHETAWRREIGPEIEAARNAVLPGSPPAALGDARLRILLEVSRVLRAAGGGDALGASVEICDEAPYDLGNPPKPWRRFSQFLRENAGWIVVAVDRDINYVGARHLLPVLVTLVSGTKYEARQRTGVIRAGEPTIELIVLPIEQQF